MSIMMFCVIKSCSELFVPWLRRLVAGVSPRWSGFAPVSVQMVFMVDKVAVG
jgi:hypothetical protein